RHRVRQSTRRQTAVPRAERKGGGVMLLTDKLPTDAEIRKMFDAVPALEKHKVADSVVRAGIKPITARARMLVPRSKASDRAKRSKKQRRENPGLDSPLWKTITDVVRTHGGYGHTSAVAI